VSVQLLVLRGGKLQQRRQQLLLGEVLGGQDPSKEPPGFVLAQQLRRDELEDLLDVVGQLATTAKTFFFFVADAPAKEADRSSPTSLAREVLLKGKDQYSWTPCTN